MPERWMNAEVRFLVPMKAPVGSDLLTLQDELGEVVDRIYGGDFTDAVGTAEALVAGEDLVTPEDRVSAGAGSRADLRHVGGKLGEDLLEARDALRLVAIMAERFPDEQTTDDLVDRGLLRIVRQRGGHLFAELTDAGAELVEENLDAARPTSVSTDDELVDPDASPPSTDTQAE